MYPRPPSVLFRNIRLIVRFLSAAFMLMTSATSQAEEETHSIEEISIGPILQRPTPFIGVGFHAFFPIHHRHTSPEQEALLHQRWKDLNPSFVRVTHQWNWDAEFAVRQMKMMQSTGSHIYLTTWDPENLTEPGAISDYGKRVANMLEDLTVNHSLDNIDWYCMTNELSLPGAWSALSRELPRFELYHRAIDKALKAKNLPVGLLATDASPTWQWNTIEWAGVHMDDITRAYGGHHYINKHLPSDLDFYEWFFSKVNRVASMAHQLGKPFIIGEFGPKQHSAPRYGFENWDGCTYFDTPDEPLAAVQTAEAVIAAANAGADAIGYWTFVDFPDQYAENYANKWGTFRWDEDFSLRPVYFCIGLLTRFFRGPADVCQTYASKELRTLAIRDRQTGHYRIAVINRQEQPVTVTLNFLREQIPTQWSRFLFDSKQADNYCGQPSLINPKNSLGESEVALASIPPQSLIVFVQN